MNQQQLIPLEAFSRIVQGGRLGLSGNDFVPEGVPAYGAGGVNGYLPIAEFDEPAVVLSSIGARCGKCFYANGEWTSLANTQLIFPDPDQADCKFLWFQLNDERRWHRSGTGQPFIKPADVKTHRVFLPPLPEQRRIAEVLDRAEGLRGKRRAALARLDTLTHANFLDMFGDPATNPKGWPIKTIGEVGKVITGNTPPRSNPAYYGTAIEWIKSDNINTPHDYLTRAEEGLSKVGKGVARIAPPGSILVTCIAGSPDCIGNAAMADREVAFNQQINALVPSTGDVRFLYTQILVGKRLVQQASTAGMKGLVSKSRFEGIRLMFPPLPLQREFARRVAAVEKLKAAHRASLAEMDALFASLQHRAFRGEL
jgi:type I restriction enzyme S subunit